MTVGRFSAWGGKLEYTTGELARLIYCDPLLHKLFGKGGPPPKALAIRAGSEGCVDIC